MGLFLGILIFVMGLVFIIFRNKIIHWARWRDNSGFWFGSYNVYKKDGKWQTRQGSTMAEYSGEKRARKIVLGIGIFLILFSLSVIFKILQ